jgi:hypothetical protein
MVNGATPHYEPVIASSATVVAGLKAGMYIPCEAATTTSAARTTSATPVQLHGNTGVHEPMSDAGTSTATPAATRSLTPTPKKPTTNPKKTKHHQQHYGY